MFNLHLRRAARLLAGCTLLTFVHLVPAQAQEFDDEAEKEWKEVALQLPASPKAENLHEFYRSGTQKFAIDTHSVTVATDGTVRYTLVATSTSGAKNISYEAIRCESYEKKLYAFGQPDGSWSRSRRKEWDRISSLAANNQHSTLAREYFCDGNTVAGNARTLVDRLNGMRPLSGL
ncbi:MAG: CNP1-like family protein [Burkholderiales bacterium]|nr:CNP1-like family protein [Burkholderiales bacterium]